MDTKKYAIIGAKFFTKSLIASGLITRKVDFDDHKDVDAAYRSMCDEHIMGKKDLSKKIVATLGYIGEQKYAGMIPIPCSEGDDLNLYLVTPHAILLRGIPCGKELQKFPTADEFEAEAGEFEQPNIGGIQVKKLGEIPEELKKVLEGAFTDKKSPRAPKVPAPKSTAPEAKQHFEENKNKKELPVEEVYDEKNLKKLKKSATIKTEEKEVVKQARERVNNFEAHIGKIFT